MMRVRACTIRCRCHSSCRRSRFSELGTQICGKRSSSSKRRISCASCRSVFCLRTRFGANLGCVSDPQLKLQLRHEALEPACVATGFHAHTHLRSAQSSIELLRLGRMRQPFFLELSALSIYRSNLLKLGMEIYSYNNHRSAPFSRACWLVLAPPTLLGPRSRHCHGINYTHHPTGCLAPRRASPGSMNVIACYQQLRLPPDTILVTSVGSPF